jgi:hypothetical protein
MNMRRSFILIFIFNINPASVFNVATFWCSRDRNLSSPDPIPDPNEIYTAGIFDTKPGSANSNTFGGLIGLPSFTFRF